MGKNVTFTIEHKTEGKDGRKGREYGIVHLGEVNLVKLIAAEGWAAVRKPAEGKEPRKFVIPFLPLHSFCHSDGR